MGVRVQSGIRGPHVRLKTPDALPSRHAGIARGVEITMQNLRASKQWFAALLSIFFLAILVPPAMAAAPTITRLIPAEVNAGWPSFTLTVEGANFVAASKVYWAGRELVTMFHSATLLTATVPANMIAAKGTATLTVSNTGTKSAGRSFIIEVQKPLITSLSPSSAPPGGPGITVTINGADFVANSTTVNWKNTATGATAPLTITYFSATELKVMVPSALIKTAGTAAITVTTAAGGTSAAATFAAEPKPVLSSLSPTSAIAGDPSVTLTISGSNFIKGALVQWKTSTKTIKLTPTGVTTTTITLSPLVTKPILVNPGKTNISASVSVITAAGTSAAKTFTITPVKPLITSLSPPSAAPGGPEFTLTINGANFVKNATTVKWKNAATGATATLSTTSVTASLIKATVPSSLIKTAGTAAVTVTTTAGGTSAGATFFFEPKPVLSSVSPTSAIAGNPNVSLTISGSNFIKGAQVVWKTPTKTTKIIPTGFTTTKITLPPTVISPLLVNSGKTNISASVSVMTAEGTSTAKTFTVLPVKPVINSLSPTSAAAGGPAFTLTVNGYNFVAGAKVYFKGVGLTTTFKKSTQLTATVPSTLIQTSAIASVTVVSNKVTSSPASFTVTSAKVTISSINPTSAVSGGPTFTLTVNGTGFVKGLTTVSWAISGNPTANLAPTLYNGTTQLKVTVTANLIANPGTATVSVNTPAGISRGVKFTILQSGPVISILNPSSIAAGQTSSLTMNIIGTNFIAGATANWTPANSNTATALTTKVVTATQLRATVPASLLANPGSANVTVTTSAGTSSPVKFTINPANGPACANDGSGNSKLNGVYSFQFTQVDETKGGQVNFNVGRFTADGSGGIIGGIQDSNGPHFASANQNVPFTGTYSVGGDGRGLITLSYTGGATANVCIALDSVTSGVAGGGRLVSDLINPQVDSGSFFAQGSSSINAATVAGSWAMGIDGEKLDPSNGAETRGATAGYITLNGGTSTVTAGEADLSQDQFSSGNLTNSSKAKVGISGTYTLASTGRGTLTLTYAGTGTSHYVFYLAGTNQILLLSTDTGGKGGSSVMAGRALMRPSSISFDNGTLSGNSVFTDQELTNTNSSQYNNRLIQAGIFSWNGTGQYNETYDENDAGTVSLLQSASSTYSVDSSGRVTISGTTPSKFGYLVDTNEGFAVSGNLGVSVLYFESQATGGFNLASFSGDYSEGSLGYEFEVEKASSGEVNADGSGSLTGNIDTAPGLGGCVDCTVRRGAGAKPNWSRPLPNVVVLDESYATSSVAGRFVIKDGSKTVQALYLVSPDKGYTVDIGNGDSWQTLEVFNHQ